MSRRHRTTDSAWRRAGGTGGLLLTAIAMGAGAINAEISIVFDRSDEGTSAVALPAFVVGLIIATTLLHRHVRL